MILCPVCGGLLSRQGATYEMDIWMCPCRFSYLESDTDGLIAWTSCGPFRTVGLSVDDIPVDEERFRDVVRHGLIQNVLES